MIVWLPCRVCAAFGAVALAGGCSVYDHRYDYPPGPVDVVAVAPGNAAAESIHTLVSMRGVRKADAKSDIPASVEVRFRVENTSGTGVSLVTKSLALFSADLIRFPDPIVVPLNAVEIPPGGSAVFEAFFPFPGGKVPGEFDLDGLNVRWALRIDGQDVTSSLSFARLPHAYYEKYPNRIGVGYMRYDH